MVQVRESFVNATEGYRFGDGDWYEPWTGDDLGKLYREGVKEYGRCTGRVYVDMTADGAGKVGPVPVGWVFVKRMEYEDAHRLPAGRERTYLREVWVEYRHVEDKED